MNQPALKKRHCTRSQIRGYRYLSRIDDCGRILRNALRDRTAVQCRYHYGTYSSNVNTLSWSTSLNQLSSEFTASDNGKWTRTCVCLTISTGYTHEFLTKGWIRRRIRHVVCRYRDCTYSSNVNTLLWATSSNQLSSEFTASDNGKWARTCVCLTISTGYTHDFLTKGWILRIRHALWYSRCSAVAFKWFGIYVQTTQELPLYRLVFAYNARI